MLTWKDKNTIVLAAREPSDEGKKKWSMMTIKWRKEYMKNHPLSWYAKNKSEALRIKPEDFVGKKKKGTSSPSKTLKKTEPKKVKKLKIEKVKVKNPKEVVENTPKKELPDRAKKGKELKKKNIPMSAVPQKDGSILRKPTKDLTAEDKTAIKEGVKKEDEAKTEDNFEKLRSRVKSESHPKKEINKVKKMKEAIDFANNADEDFDSFHDAIKEKFPHVSVGDIYNDFHFFFKKKDGSFDKEKFDNTFGGEGFNKLLDRNYNKQTHTTQYSNKEFQEALRQTKPLETIEDTIKSSPKKESIFKRAWNKVTSKSKNTYKEKVGEDEWKQVEDEAESFDASEPPTEEQRKKGPSALGNSLKKFAIFSIASLLTGIVALHMGSYVTAASDLLKETWEGLYDFGTEGIEYDDYMQGKMRSLTASNENSVDKFLLRLKKVVQSMPKDKLEEILKPYLKNNGDE